MEGIDENLFDDLPDITNSKLLKKSLASLKKLKEKIKKTSVARKFDEEKEVVL